MSTLQCTACNTPIPIGARFCGRCGKYIDVDQVNTKQLTTDQDSSTIFTSDLSTREDDWNLQRVDDVPTMRFPPESAWLPLAGVSIGPSPVNMPVVQGSPQIGGVPSLQGTPQGPGGAMTQAPLQQPPAGAGGASAPNAPPAPMNRPSITGPHHQHQRRGWPRKRHQEPHHQPSHHLYNSGHLHNSGALHSSSQALRKHTGRTATKSLKHLGRWHLKSVIMAALSVCVLGGLAALFLVPLLNGHAQTPPATLILNGNVVPGGSISIQGRNFTPGGTITLSIDGHSATSAGSSSTAQSRNLPGPTSLGQVSLLQLAQQMTKAQAAATTITVKSDGSFETAVQIDPGWPVGSSHTLVATESSSGQQAHLMIVVPRPAQLVSCASATATTSIVLGPVPEGQAQPASSSFALCTNGSGLVQWTASWQQNQAKWLQVEQTGGIQAPLSKQLTISASATGLKAGSYNVIVTFTDQNGLKVSLKVTFLVRSAQATACLTTSTQSLTFTAAQGQANPASQLVSLTNCGSSGSWSSTSHTDDGANWLTVNPASGQLNGKASSAVSVSASSSLLGQGIYTGQVTFKMGSGIAVVNVILNMQPSPKSPSCMSVAPQSLAFSATQGQGNPGSQVVTIGNCGPAAAWSATTSTTDGAKWLTLNPGNGNLTTNTSANVSITVSSANLQTATYSGQVTFKMGSSSQTVNVSFTVLQQQQKTCLSVNPQSLPFTATQGQGDPAAQTVTLINCGPAGTWTASTANGSSWLNISPTGNTLNAGASQSVSVNPSISGLSAGTYSDTIAFALATSSGTTRQTVSVSLTVQPPPPPPPCIRANPGSLSFTGTQGQSNPAAQTVTLTNCGSDGSWSASTANGSGWLGISPASNTLSAGIAQSVNISASLSGLKASAYTDTITFTITTGTGTAQATVSVSLTVQSPQPPCIQVNTGSLAFTGTQGQGDPAPQTVTLTNCGADATWSASTANGSSWLNITPASNALSAGTSQGVTVSPSISGLSANTYSDTITFTMTNGGGTTRQTVAVTLTVQSPPSPPCLKITSISPPPSSTDGIVYVYVGSTITVVVTNCGNDTGTLSSVDNTSWLTDNLQSGTTIAGGGSQTITISASTSAPPGNKGTVAITLKTSGGQAPVTITVGILNPIS